MHLNLSKYTSQKQKRLEEYYWLRTYKETLHELWWKTVKEILKWLIKQKTRLELATLKIRRFTAKNYSSSISCLKSRYQLFSLKVLNKGFEAIWNVRYIQASHASINKEDWKMFPFKRIQNIILTKTNRFRALLVHTLNMRDERFRKAILSLRFWDDLC